MYLTLYSLVIVLAISTVVCNNYVTFKMIYIVLFLLYPNKLYDIFNLRALYLFIRFAACKPKQFEYILFFSVAQNMNLVKRFSPSQSMKVLPLLIESKGLPYPCPR